MRTKAKRTVLGNRCLLWFSVTSIQRSWGLWPFMEGWEAVRLFLLLLILSPFFVCLFACLFVVVVVFFLQAFSFSKFIPFYFFLLYFGLFFKTAPMQGGKRARQNRYTQIQKSESEMEANKKTSETKNEWNKKQPKLLELFPHRNATSSHWY